MEFVAAQLQEPYAFACLVDLLAHAHSADLAAAAGWQAVDLRCDDDSVSIALADGSRSGRAVVVEFQIQSGLYW